MDHSEATKRMAVERYLLDELAPQERDAFEEHMFGCEHCAMDLRAASAFVEEARQQLPGFSAKDPTLASSSPVPSEEKKRRGFLSRVFSPGPSYWRPSFAVPAFACLLALIAYQNLSVIPRLHSAVSPRIVPWSILHLGARGAGPVQVAADRKQGAVVLIQLPESVAYPSYILDFYDANARLVWSRTVAAPGPASEGTFSLVIPAANIEPGSSTLAISGVSPQGGRTEVDRRVLDVHFDQ